ncbi:hypothetical protein C7445_109131 [Alicyclobacillus sacchari]|uniref:Uncharacterized protein n=1 Tax=Alicyclobacillus sacchari TaxID=392010 RepID=A0A4R8LKJ0_9BACL|nr:hypothetical protein C7445_109131 [Alicyclobacillus sacchari]
MTSDREQSNRKPPRIMKLLDQPICRTTVPMAVSTKRIFQRHQEVLCKLKRYLEE